MTERRIRHMPIVEGGELVGIVSIGDVVKRKIEETEQEAIALKRIHRLLGIAPSGGHASSCACQWNQIQHAGAVLLPAGAAAWSCRLSNLSKASSRRNLAASRRSLSVQLLGITPILNQGSPDENLARHRRARRDHHRPRYGPAVAAAQDASSVTPAATHQCAARPTPRQVASAVRLRVRWDRLASSMLVCSDNGAEALEIALVRMAHRLDLTADQQTLFDTFRPRP